VFADLLEYEDRTGEELGAELYMEHCPPHLEGETHTLCFLLGAWQCSAMSLVCVQSVVRSSCPCHYASDATLVCV
jgi:hypothetical protein